MNVAIVDADISYPATSGKRLRTLNLMTRLARRHALTYIARGTGDREQEARAVKHLADFGIATVVVDHPLAPKKGLGFYARLAGNLFSPLPYSVTSHVSPIIAKAVADHAVRHPVDLWQVEWPGYMLSVPAGGAPRVLMAPNIDTLIWQRYYEAEANPLKRWYIGNQWRKFARFEREVFRAASRVVVVSEEDATLARRQFQADNVRVVDNGIDRAYFEGVQLSPHSKQILYLGSLDWRPNLDALELLLNRIFPMVRAQVPDATLSIVGRSPPPWLRTKVLALPGVELHGDVPDVRPFLANSACLAVPLRIGGGSRLKILEALVCGLPVVSTGVGAEGLHLEPGTHYLLADTPEEMARSLTSCLRSPSEARQQARQSRDVVLGMYDWDRLAEKMESVWEECLGRSTCTSSI